jgi:hypothetical protein
MVTNGLGSVTSCERNEVVLAEVTADEWSHVGVDDWASFERRLSKQLGRNDLRVVRLLSVQDKPTADRGESFQDSRKRYTPPILIYSCACCGGGRSRSVRQTTVEEFEQSGGKISVVGSLAIR